METDHTTPQAPDISHEEMKLPENARHGHKPDKRTPLSGLIIGILVLLLLFVLGGLYLWFAELTAQLNTQPTLTAVERPTAEQNNEPESTTAEAAVETQTALSTSDEIIAIEADLLATDLDLLLADLTAIEAELNAALGDI